MRKILLFLTSSFVFQNNASAQFAIMNPGISVNNIEDIKTDTNGHVVFGTDNGILIYKNSIWSHFDLSNGLHELDIKAIGIYNGGFRYSAINRRIGQCDFAAVMDTIFNGIDTFNYISAININTTNDTFYGTDNGKVYLSDPSAAGVINFGPLGSVTDIGQLHNPPAFSVDFHVIATTNKAAIYQVSTGTSVIISTTTSPIPSNKILSHTIKDAITYDGTDKGLYIVDFSSYPSLGTSIIHKANASIPCDTISAVAVSDSTIFIGTPKGLAVFSNRHWYVYDSLNSNLPSNAIARLSVDTNSLWIGTSRGEICRFYFDQIPSSVKEIKPTILEYALFPNPADNYVSVNAAITAGNLELYDVNSKKVLETTFKTSNKISLKPCVDGLYFYHVSSNDNQQSATGRLIIKR
jgi:type IX secretion system substrate protein